MKSLPAFFIVLAMALPAPEAARADGSPARTQNTATRKKPKAVECEVVTGTHIRRTTAQECGKSVRAYGSFDWRDVERGSSLYRPAGSIY